MSLLIRQHAVYVLSVMLFGMTGIGVAQDANVMMATGPIVGGAPFGPAQIGVVTTRGMAIPLQENIEIVKNQQGREPAGAYRDHIVELAFERGLLILGCGENSIRLAPPLIVNEHEAAIALDILEECVEHAKKDTAPRKEGEPMGA